MKPGHCSRAFSVLASFVAVIALHACSPPQTSCTSTTDCRSGETCFNGACTARPDGSLDGRVDAQRDASPVDGNGGFDRVDAGPPCTEGASCPGGVCVTGACCPANNVCASACCGAGETCFASACVTPGRPCRTAADCDTGSYCESAFGTGAGSDAGTRDASTPDGGRVCSSPSPSGGRCLALPPSCPEPGDGGVSADAGPGCISRCEYRPPTGRLNAEVAWSWGQPRAPSQFPGFVDVWSTPAVGRFYDANCDGRVDSLDPPDLVFVSGRAVHTTTGIGTCCQCTGAATSACLTGVLRVLDGRTGADLLALRSASATSAGFAGVSVALADIDNDGDMEIAAVTAEGFIVIIEASGRVVRTSNMPIPGHGNATFGWGGGLAIADMDGDGFPEIAYGPTVYTTAGGALTLRFSGMGGGGGGAVYEYLSTFADVDGAADNHLELVAGRTVYRSNGTVLWDRADLGDGFPAVADFNADRRPEVVLVTSGRVLILDGATGVTRLGPTMLPGTGFGGAPTVADFDRTAGPEIGVAQQNFYSVLDPDFTTMRLNILWSRPNHDLSSSVTGSTVFDFEGDGVAEVLYQDECFVWVFDGPTGNVRFAGLTTSFTGTEASIVADVDGDGHAEIVSIANGADPSAAGWGCNVAPWNAPDVATGRPAWQPPTGAPAYRGIRVFRDAARSWVGTRSIWNQHTYHVTNVCADGDDACPAGSHEGQIPRTERANWTLPWLNNFRQNVQQAGLFNAPDASVTLTVRCIDPPVLVASVRNLGAAILPAGVVVGFYAQEGGTERMLGMATTTSPLFPGGVEDLVLTTARGSDPSGLYIARILIDPATPMFRECRSDNNESRPMRAQCPG